MISPMKNGDIECILGAKIDPVFGPIVMFGLGGIYAEVMKDIVFAEAPVSKQKAEQMILSLKSKDIFYGARGKPPIEINSLLNAIINLSINYNKPIGNGIITALNLKQAKERSGIIKSNKPNKGLEATRAILSILKNGPKKI